MTTAIVFSKNRAAQLDLLLRSIEENAPGLYSRVHIIWKGDSEYADAYRVCQDEHEWAELVEETDLRAQTLALVNGASGLIAFLMDDCVFYRPQAGRDPAAVLGGDEDVLCFSPRLGLNTTVCYPLRRRQDLPVASAAEDGVMYWEWQGGDADFSYPGSLDGHLFRVPDMLAFLHAVTDWRTPNGIEEGVMRVVDTAQRPLMACHERSSLVGLPLNLVNETHPNRHGETHPHHPAHLNAVYLAGERILLDSVDPATVDAAHIETPLLLSDAKMLA